MKLSKGVRYALRMMVDIAKESDGTNRVALSQVARHTCMPRRYLEQLAIPLRRASLLAGTTGRRGGYVLARPAQDISVGEIIESVVGRLSITNCVLDPASCTLADGCECRGLYQRVNTEIAKLFDRITLADLLREDWVQSAGTGRRRRRTPAASLRAGRGFPAERHAPSGKGSLC
ncbi:MAG: Rrf2 family transcriptional regulator [Planctomycetota bacterium]